MTDEGVRYKLVQVSNEILQRLCTQGTSISIECIEGLPEGARSVAAYVDHDRNLITIIFEHESFPLVKWAGTASLESYPLQTVLFKTIEEKKE